MSRADDATRTARPIANPLYVARLPRRSYSGGLVVVPSCLLSTRWFRTPKREGENRVPIWPIGEEAVDS